MKPINPNRKTFIYCPSCGKKELKPVSDKSFCCSSCNFNFYINCAAAAMALIFDKQQRLLVTTRKRDPAKGTLDLPGGFADPGEGIDQCLIREIKEELNLEVTSLSFLRSFPNTYQYKNVTYPITDMAFVCQVKTFNKMTARDDVAAFEFIALENINPADFGMESARKAVQHIAKKQKASMP